MCLLPLSVFFFFNDTPTTEIYTLSLHDALPIFADRLLARGLAALALLPGELLVLVPADLLERSEEHTSELQSRRDLVCRLLLEKKKHNRTLLLPSVILPQCHIHVLVSFSLNHHG